MSTLTKYWDKYSKRGKTDSSVEAKQHMTDREAYISFLEVQLERVTQSVLVTQGFSDRIEQLQGQVNTVEDKILNVTRLVKLQQNYVEGQEDEITNVKAKLEGALREHHPSSPPLDPQFESRLKKLEDQLQSRDPPRPKEPDETRSELRMMVSVTQALLKDQRQRFDEELEKVQEKFMGALEVLEDNQNEQIRRLDKKFSEAQSSLSRSPSFDPSLNPQQFSDLEHLLHVLAEEFKSMKSHMTTIDQDLSAALRRKPSLPSISEDSQNDRFTKLEGIVVGTAERLKELEGKLGGETAVDIEKVVSKKISKAVERMGELLKRYIDAQKSLHSAVSDLTARVDRLDKGKLGARKASPGRGRGQTSE